MDGETLLERLRETNATELNRLGSEKALLAATGAQLQTDRVLAVTRATLEDAAGALAAWADTLEGPAADALRSVADRFEAAADSVADAGATDAAGAESVLPALEAEGPVERVAVGLFAVPLLLDRFLLQGVSFFVNEAETGRADLFRELRELTDRTLSDGVDALEAVDGDPAAGERAASATVQAAYDEYVRRLESMGLDPKPIC